MPDQPAAPDRSTSGISSARLGSPSEPPSSSSQFSSSRTGTPRPQTLERAPLHNPGFLPLFAALGGLAAAASAIFWVTHRPAPTPLITTTLATAHAAHTAARDTSADPAGVNIDSLPTAGAPMPGVPDAEAMSAALVGPTPIEKAASVSGKPKEPKEPKEPKDTVAVVATAPPDPPPPAALDLPPPSERPALSRGAAMATLSSAASSAMACKRPGGPTGAGTANITFSPDGPVKSVAISPPFAGTPVGQCVATVFRAAHVPPFSGSAFTLPKSFQIPE